MSQRIFVRLLLAVALAFTGSVVQLHSLTHAQYDLAAARQAAKGLAPLGKAPAPLTHSTDQCLVFHALDSVETHPGALLTVESVSSNVISAAVDRRGRSPAAAFQPRAPPQFI